MKKALALVLALVLALSMAVSAFALTLDLVGLDEVKTPGTKLIPLNTIVLNDTDVTLVGNAGDVYHVLIENAEAYKNFEVTASGIASAKFVEYDPTVYADIENVEYNYSIFDKAGNRITMTEYATYQDALDGIDAIEDALKQDLVVECLKEIVLLEITLEDNWSASYKEGTLKVTATRVADGKAVAGKWTVISDVVIFEYEEVKWAGNDKTDALVVGVNGYSDYETALNGYGDKYVIGDLRTEEGAAVVSTTAFRAIKGNQLTVKALDEVSVVIEEVADTQRGVNFSAYGVTPINEKGLVAAKGEAEYIEFGFYGDQVVKGDFTVKVALDYTWYTLREAFGVKVEEDDILTYYIVKDGKVVKEIVVDYMTADIDEQVKFNVELSDSTLGNYEVRLDVTSTAEGGEENPNTGAESVVGVVAALAVVSVATAAAVSLKK